MTKAQNDRNTVIYGPNRSAFEYKLDRIEEQVEDFKRDVQPIVNEYEAGTIGGGGFETCTITAYDPVTRAGSADCSGTPTDFDNTSPWTFNIGDDILIGTDGLGNHYGIGLANFGGGGGGGTGPSFTFVPIGNVPGLPYDVGAPGVGTIFQAGEGFITTGSTFALGPTTAGGTIVDIVTPNSFVLPVSVAFANGLALSRLPTGTFAFQRGRDFDIPVTTNSLVVIHNNVVSTYNYGGVRTIGVSNGVAYCYATHKAGIADPYFITVDSTGTVADFLPTVQDELGNVVSFVGPNIEPSASGSWWLAGDYGVAWSPFVGGIRYIYTFAHGTTAARRWPSAVGNFVYGLTTAQRFGRITMDDSHIFAIDTQSSGTRRSWRRMALATGIINDFPDNLPVGAVSVNVAAGGNAEAILIAGTYDDGLGPLPVYFTTSGTGVTITLLDDAFNTPTVRRDFTGNILAEFDSIAVGHPIVVGVSL